MKYLILISTIFLIISCNSFKPTLKEGYTNNISNTLDSITNSNHILFPDTSLWIKSSVRTNEGPINSRFIIIKWRGRNHIMNIMKINKIWYYTYRIE